MMTKGCMLDFEETVADLSNCYKVAFNKAFGEFKISFEETRLQEYIDTPLNEIFERYYTGCTCKYRDFVTVFMSAFDRAFPDSVVPKPGAVEMIKSLKEEGYSVAIIGDTYGMYMNLFLSKFGLEQYVSAVFGIEQMAVPRPDAYSFRTCLSRMGCDASDSIIVSSLEKNLTPAGRMGMRVLPPS